MLKQLGNPAAAPVVGVVIVVGGLAWGSLVKPRKGSGLSNCLADLPAMPPGATSFEVVPIARWGFMVFPS